MKELVNIFSPSITALIGAIVGACLQYYFTRKNDEKKQLSSIKKEVYSEFINAIKDAKFNGDISLLASSKAKLAIYGSDEVVKKSADFFRNHSELSSEKSIQAFTDIIGEMRTDNGKKNGNAEHNDLECLVFGAK